MKPVSKLFLWGNDLLPWLPAVVMMGLIYFFSSRASYQLPQLPYGDTIFKKSGHMLGYALLVLSYLRGLGKANRREVGLALILCLAYACSDELHQRFSPGRTSTYVDVMIDFTGALLGVLALFTRQGLRRVVFWKRPPEIL